MRIFTPWLILCIAAIVGFGQSETNDEFAVSRTPLSLNPETEAIIRKIEKHFSRVIIPEVRFEETPFKDAVGWLQNESVERDFNPEITRRGISVIISNPPVSSKPSIRESSDAGFGFEAGPIKPEIDVLERRITMQLNNVSVLEAFVEAASLAGMRVRVEMHALIMEPENSDDPTLYLTEYIIPEKLENLIATQPFTKTADPFAKTVEMAESKLENAINRLPCIPKPVKYDDKKRQLRIAASRKQIAEFEEILWVWTDGKMKLIDRSSGGTIKIEASLITNHYTIQPDHWLWLQRIIKNDNNFVPDGYNTAEPKFDLRPFRTAKEAYQNCGIVLTEGETFIYSAPTSVLIAKLTLLNHQRVKRLHARVANLRSGQPQ